MDWKDAHWRELFDAPGRGRIVVPVIGPDLLAVERPDGPALPFPMLLAERLAAQLASDERARLPAAPMLHELALSPRWRGREAEFAVDLADVQEAALEEVLPSMLDP